MPVTLHGKSLEHLLRRQIHFGGYRLRGQIAGIHFVLAQLVADPKPIENSYGIRLGHYLTLIWLETSAAPKNSEKHWVQSA
jgi:hypothetical protein